MTIAKVIRQTELAGLISAALLGETAPEQPIPFSHKTHVPKGAHWGLRCQFCHVNAEPGEDMGLPDAAKCMACHAAIAKDNAAIQALRGFAQSKQPIPWVRVYSLPAEVFWSHRPHVRAELTCDACHGAVSEMDVVAHVTNVTTMQGCVDCHKQHKVSVGCNFCHDDK